MRSVTTFGNSGFSACVNCDEGKYYSTNGACSTNKEYQWEFHLYGLCIAVYCVQFWSVSPSHFAFFFRREKVFHMNGVRFPPPLVCDLIPPWPIFLTRKIESEFSVKYVTESGASGCQTCTAGSYSQTRQSFEGISTSCDLCPAGLVRWLAIQILNKDAILLNKDSLSWFLFY